MYILHIYIFCLTRLIHFTMHALRYENLRNVRLIISFHQVLLDWKNNEDLLQCYRLIFFMQKKANSKPQHRKEDKYSIPHPSIPFPPDDVIIWSLSFLTDSKRGTKNLVFHSTHSFSFSSPFLFLLFFCI